MSVMAMQVRPELSSGGPFTRADLEDMPDDGRRYEIIDGVLLVSAAPGRLHQRVVARLCQLLDSASPEGFEAILAPFAVGLAKDTEIQPDVLVARAEDLTEKDLPGAPALAVEVLSPSSRLFDTHVKRERFERAGTPAFWVFDPVARPAEARLIAWELGPDGRYREVANAVGEEAYQAKVPYPVSVVPADLVR